MVNVALVGIGMWGKNYYLTLKDYSDHKIVAIHALKDSIDYFESNFEKIPPHIRRYDSYSDLLTDFEIDAVIIATPPALHYAMAKEALEKGKHVLLEKPMTLDHKEAGDLVEISRTTDRVLMIGHIHFYNKYIQHLKKRIKEGFFGKIDYISTWFGSQMKRTDVGIIWDVLPHDLALFMCLIDDAKQDFPNKFSASKSSNGDILTVDLSYPNGWFCTSVVSWNFPVKTRELVVAGDKATAYFNDYCPDKIIYVKADGETETIKEDDSESPLDRQLNHFFDCIENGKKPLTDAENGFKTVKVMGAIQNSFKGK